MTTAFEDILIETFETLSVDRFKVNLESRHLFVCGGPVDVTSTTPLSFRDHFMGYSASHFTNIHEAIVLAEKFKDYFKENAYSDLMTFEEDIANISSLVIIFLESAGSLVELGIFCTKPDLFKKLIIIAPQEKVSGEDSFIYLGPIENIRKKEETAICIYPWPQQGDTNYNTSDLEDLCNVINKKLLSLPKNIAFNRDNSGHTALLIADIIRVCYPITLYEIELILSALNLDIKNKETNRYIYLLTKLGFINFYLYSQAKYFYPKHPEHRTLSFGKTSLNNNFDEGKLRITLSQSLLNNDDKSRKRRNAMTQIMNILRDSKNDC